MAVFTLPRPKPGYPLNTAEFGTYTTQVETAIRALQAVSPGTGTVTRVGLLLPTSVFNITVSPVISTGVLTATFKTQTANTIFSGPTTGSAAAPTFRSLVIADIPTITIAKGGTGITSVAASANKGIKVNSGSTAYELFTYTAGSTKLSITPGSGTMAFDVVPANIEINGLAASSPLSIVKGGTGATTAQAAINSLTQANAGTIGYILKLDGSKNAVWAAVSGTGTVTSVDISVPTGFSLSGNPITTNGTITISTTLNGYLKGNGSNTITALSSSSTRVDILPTLTSNGGKYTVVNSGGTDIEYVVGETTPSGITEQSVDYTITSAKRTVLMANPLAAVVTLPDSPDLGTVKEVVRLNNSVNNVTVSRGGASNQILDQSGALVSTIVMTVSGGVVALKYVKTNVWTILYAKIAA